MSDDKTEELEMMIWDVQNRLDVIGAPQAHTAPLACPGPGDVLAYDSASSGMRPTSIDQVLTSTGTSSVYGAVDLLRRIEQLERAFAAWVPKPEGLSMDEFLDALVQSGGGDGK